MVQPNFVSLFSGAGGLDIGLEEAGWVCRYASDIDEAAVATLNSNKRRPLRRARALEEAFIEQADVTASTGREILAKSGVAKGDVTLLAGGPPCQSWSSAGHQQGFDDPRGQLFNDFIGRVWTDTGAYRDPLMASDGPAGIDAMIAGVQGRFAGFVLKRTSKVESHNGACRFSWSLGPAAGPTVVEGVDFCSLAADGRFASIVGFIDKMPAG